MDVDGWIATLQLLRNYYGNLNYPFFSEHDVIGIEKEITIPALAQKLEKLGWIYSDEYCCYIIYI